MRLYKSDLYTDPFKYVPQLEADDMLYVQVDLLKATNETKIVSLSDIFIIIDRLLSNDGPRHQNLGHLNWKTHRKQNKIA